jgi:hypothetical protein
MYTAGRTYLTVLPRHFRSCANRETTLPHKFNQPRGAFSHAVGCSHAAQEPRTLH